MKTKENEMIAEFACAITDDFVEDRCYPVYILIQEEIERRTKELLKALKEAEDE